MLCVVDRTVGFANVTVSAMSTLEDAQLAMETLAEATSLEYAVGDTDG